MKGGCRKLAIALAATLTASAGCGDRPQPVERVVLVTIDTLRWDHLGYMGHDVATPNLDRLADSGTIFTQAITSAPITLPSHASILSGLYPPSHAARNNGTFRLSDDVETVAESLKEAGFATGAFVGAFVLDRRFGLEQGFDRYDDELPEENPLHTTYYPERPAEEVVSRAIDWMREREDEPFFLWVHVFDPHAPYNPPSPYRERYAGRPYVGEIAYTDAALGTLFDAVNAIEGGKRTAVIVTADHGESLGEHGESTHALFVYDATVRVPLILKAPGIPSGARVERQVRTVDIAPTILELSGLTPSGPLDGVSLLWNLDSREPPEPSAYGESFVPRLNFNWSELRFLRKDGFKFIEAPGRELYDLRNDPNEENNLWSESPPGEGRRLLEELSELRAASDREELSPSLEVDEETARRLESLGYVGTSLPASRGKGARPDPKDRIEVHEKLQTLLGSDLSAKALIQEYREVLVLDPKNVLARTRMANELAGEGRLEEAITEYQEILRVSELDTRSRANLAAALLLLDRVEEALEVTKRAVSEVPWDPDLHVLRGEALEKAGRFPEAMAAYDTARQLRLENPENHWRHGTVALHRGDKEGAEADFREALAQDSSFEPALTALARLLARDGRAEEAMELLSSASPEASEHGEPGTPETKAALAEVFLATQRYDEARSLLEEARAQAPENTRVLALLGPVYGRAGELGKAAETLREAIALGEKAPEVRRNLALVYLQQGKLEAAVSELRTASQDAPGDASIWFSLGNVYLRAKESRRAATALEKALELRPLWPEATFNLALAYERAGMAEKAAEAYRSFLSSGGAADAGKRNEAERSLAVLEGRGRR